MRPDATRATRHPSVRSPRPRRCHMRTRAGPSSRWPGWSAAVLLSLLAVVGSTGAEELDPGTLTKYLDPLPVPGAMPMAAPNYYEIGAWQIQQQLHSQLPMTTVWGYGPTQATASYPAATI